ncbi:MAG: malectin domain-containing carbohydrate-binding protein [bacterium]|nr:malectin domain-containing carbohydrate-binding protein [bacterium]
MHKILTLLTAIVLSVPILGQQSNYYIDAEAPVYYTPGSFDTPPSPGDTIFIASGRTKALIFKDIEGSFEHPIVVINNGGQVNINTTYGSAIDFRDCKHIKLSGRGTATDHYGFKLIASNCGVAFSGLSSHCEIEFVEIDHDGFFGIMAKKDFGGNPPYPIPVFEHLVIHDNLIKNVTEGMYIGETKSPGMEFKHLRIFNNITQNTGREGIQIANAVEDVAVYNNFIWNAGVDHKKYHGKSLQIGDNSVGRFYNNVMIGAYEHSFIALGSGDIEITNNYCADSEGGYIDNRTISTEEAPILIEGNYFYNMQLDYVIRNLNEINPIELMDNQWYGGASTVFYRNNSGASANSTETGTSQAPFAVITNPNLSVPYPQFPAPYQDMGPQPGLSFTMNYLPKLDLPKEYMADWNKADTLELGAYTADGDGIQYDLSGLPTFIQVQVLADGSARLLSNPTPSDKGVYPIKVVLSDNSHGDKTRLAFEYIVRNPNNTAPRIDFSGNIQLLTLSQDRIDVPITDAEGDEIIVSVLNIPAFMALDEHNGQHYLATDVRYRHAGSIHTIKIIADDQFGGVDSVEVDVHVFHKQIATGTPVIRVNCGGPELVDLDLTWEDGYHQITPFEITKTHRTGSHGWSGNNTTGAPDNLFGPFATQGFSGDQMYWSMPVDEGTYEVNLFFAERSQDINDEGPVVFDMLLNGNLALDNFSIYAEAGLAALKKTFTVSILQGETIDLEFISIQNKPKINGIEIVYLSGGNHAPVLPPLDNLDICTGLGQQLTIQATDPDAEPIKYLVSGLPSYATATYHPDSVVIDFAPAPEHAGEAHLITLFAIDARNTAAEGELFAIIIDCNGNALIEAGRDEVVAQQDLARTASATRSHFAVPASATTGVQAYPNPAAGWLAVNVDGPAEGTYAIELIDVQGRVHRIAHTKTEGGRHKITITLDRGNLPAGFYSLRAVSDEGWASAPQALILQ